MLNVFPQKQFPNLMLLKRYLFGLSLLLGTTLFANEQEERLAAIDRALPSVVAIFPAEVETQAGGGSGVVISPDGYALTNFHVVQPCGVGMKCGMADGRLYDAVVVGIDPVGDIALIKLLGRTDFPFSPLGDSDTVRVGDAALVMGNPFLLSLDFKPSVSWGMISGIHRYQFPSGTFLEYTDCLQTDAAINPGNSGGPLFDGRGTLIGINGRCSFEKRGRINVGIGYAVSSNQIRHFLGDLKSGRIVDHASFGGIVVTDKTSGKVMIDDMITTSDAYRQGVRWDEELLRFAGRPVDSANTFKNILGIFPAGWRVPVSVRGKDSQRRDLLVRLPALHSEADLIGFTEEMLEPPVPPEQPGDRKKPDAPNEPDTPGDMEGNEAPGKATGKKVRPRPVPEFAKPFYEKQRGYSNYHFNRVERDRVLTAWKKTGLIPLADPPESGTWTLSGTLSGRTESYAFTVDAKGVTYKLPVAEGVWEAEAMRQERAVGGSPIPHYQQPLGSGGLFTVLWLVRRLATSGQFDFGEVTYVGTAPLNGDLRTLYDVLAVYWEGNLVRLYFDPVDARLAMVEIWTDSQEHPSEIAFCSDRIEVRWGSVFYGGFGIEGKREKEEIIATGKPQPVVAETGADAGHSFPFEKMVKIYGAGGGGFDGYQSGCLVAPDGRILTVLSPVLEADPIRIVLADGRRCEAKLLDADPVLEIALLKIDGTNLPFFEFCEPGVPHVRLERPVSPASTDLFDARFRPGDRVYALSNTFNIAQGAETVSVQQGIIAARTTLTARRGAFATPYKGPVYIVDFTTNNPGAAGGVLISRDDDSPIGLIGKELRNAENNTWINYILPKERIAAKLAAMLTRDPSQTQRPLLLAPEAIRPEQELIPADTEPTLRHWGLLLVPDVATRTPPFVDAVRTGSEAEKQGVREDDLIVMLNGRLTPSRAVFERILLQILEENPRSITLTLEREAELIDVTLAP